MKPNRTAYRVADDQLLINVKEGKDKAGNPRVTRALYLFRKDVECQVALLGGKVTWDANAKDGIAYFIGNEFTAKNSGKVYQRLEGYVMTPRDAKPEIQA